MKGILVWTDLSVTQVTELFRAKDHTQRLALLRKAMGISGDTARDLALLDLYLYAIVFAMQHGFTADKASTLVSLLKATHIEATSTSLDNFQAVLAGFQETLLRHTVQRPPMSEAVFTLQDADLVLEYVLTTYFRHFKLYKYTFTKKPLLRVDAAVEESSDKEAISAQ